MKLLIDGVEYGNINLERESRATLSDMAKQRAENNGRLIVFLKTSDGEKYDFYGQGLFEKLGVHYEYIDLITATPREIALAGIYDSVVMLEKVKNDIKKASEMLITGEYEKGMKIFSLCTRDISVVIDMVKKLKSSGLINFVEDNAYVNEFFGKSGAMNNILLQIEDAISLEDQVMTSDLLEYELLPVIENWQASMPSIYKGLLESPVLH
jgi:hypothetical protein